jgi:hypothetical protein
MNFIMMSFHAVLVKKKSEHSFKILKKGFECVRIFQLILLEPASSI